MQLCVRLWVQLCVRLGVWLCVRQCVCVTRGCVCLFEPYVCVSSGLSLTLPGLVLRILLCTVNEWNYRSVLVHYNMLALVAKYGVRISRMGYEMLIWTGLTVILFCRTIFLLVLKVSSVQGRNV